MPKRAQICSMELWRGSFCAAILADAESDQENCCSGVFVGGWGRTVQDSQVAVKGCLNLVSWCRRVSHRCLCAVGGRTDLHAESGVQRLPQ
eukprot:921054-Alexandrium_andersonii.AAC.1